MVDCQQWHDDMFLSEDRFIQPDSSDQSPRIDSHWFSLGHMPIADMLQQECFLNCSDWLSLGHQSIPADGSRVIFFRATWSDHGGGGGVAPGEMEVLLPEEGGMDTGLVTTGERELETHG